MSRTAVSTTTRSKATTDPGVTIMKALRSAGGRLAPAVLQATTALDTATIAATVSRLRRDQVVTLWRDAANQLVLAVTPPPRPTRSGCPPATIDPELARAAVDHVTRTRTATGTGPSWAELTRALGLGRRGGERLIRALCRSGVLAGEGVVRGLDVGANAYAAEVAP